MVLSRNLSIYFHLKSILSFFSIRTVAAFGGENSEIKRYGDFLVEAMKKGQKSGLLAGGFHMFSFVFF